MRIRCSSELAATPSIPSPRFFGRSAPLTQRERDTRFTHFPSLRNFIVVFPIRIHPWSLSAAPRFRRIHPLTIAETIVPHMTSASKRKPSSAVPDRASRRYSRRFTESPKSVHDCDGSHRWRRIRQTASVRSNFGLFAIATFVIQPIRIPCTAYHPLMYPCHHQVA